MCNSFSNPSEFDIVMLHWRILGRVHVGCNPLSFELRKNRQKATTQKKKIKKEEKISYITCIIMWSILIFKQLYNVNKYEIFRKFSTHDVQPLNNSRLCFIFIRNTLHVQCKAWPVLIIFNSHKSRQTPLYNHDNFFIIKMQWRIVTEKIVVRKF